MCWMDLNLLEHIYALDGLDITVPGNVCEFVRLLKVEGISFVRLLVAEQYKP